MTFEINFEKMPKEQKKKKVDTVKLNASKKQKEKAVSENLTVRK